MASAYDNESTVEGKIFQMEDFDEIHSMHFVSCDFVQVNFDDLVDVMFERCRFEACTFRGGIYSSQFLFASLEDQRIANTYVVDSHFSSTNLRKSEIINTVLTGSSFDECNLSKASLLDCDATYTIFLACDLSGSRLDDTDLSAADLE